MIKNEEYFSQEQQPKLDAHAQFIKENELASKNFMNTLIARNKRVEEFMPSRLMKKKIDSIREKMGKFYDES